MPPKDKSLLRTVFSQSGISIVLGILISHAAPATEATAERQKHAEPSLMAHAHALVGERRYDEARSVLEQLISDMPPNWAPRTETSESVTGAYWELAEFACAVALAKREKDERGIDWVKPSYRNGIIDKDTYQDVPRPTR